MGLDCVALILDRKINVTLPKQARNVSGAMLL